MSARILVVDDEPGVEALILQKFRHRTQDGAISFLFARDGVEALATLKANSGIDLRQYRDRGCSSGWGHRS
jgi:adenylate cyclase